MELDYCKILFLANEFLHPLAGISASTDECVGHCAHSFFRAHRRDYTLSPSVLGYFTRTKADITASTGNSMSNHAGALFVLAKVGQSCWDF